MTYDSDSFSGSIGDTNSQTVTVSAANADYIYVTIDDGTQGSSPSQYDFTVDKHTVDLGGSSRKQELWTETGVTKLSWRIEAVGGQMDFTIKNTSGSSANFDIEAESRQWSGA